MNIFKEVLSSYLNENYRSVTVMLYSIAICDILFKLQELNDMYNDTVPRRFLVMLMNLEILIIINQNRNGKKN